MSKAFRTKEEIIQDADNNKDNATVLRNIWFEVVENKKKYALTEIYDIRNKIDFYVRGIAFKDVKEFTSTFR